MFVPQYRRLSVRSLTARSDGEYDPPEESGDEWSPEGSGNESRKRDRDDSDEDFDEPVAKRTNKMSEPSEDSDVVHWSSIDL